MISFREYIKEQTHKEIASAVRPKDWQTFRKSLKGLSTSTKLQKLSQWVSKKGGSKKAKLQASNYRNALKRGGLL